MRHESALRRVLRNGRGASRTAFPRWSGLPPESWTVLARRLSPVFYGAQAV
ncbi:hypothetical protein N028_21930 [Pseudomonas syringae USA011]|nr:hypothetical protein N028_21930 [Pseudomonas syringae USA011]